MINIMLAVFGILHLYTNFHSYNNTPLFGIYDNYFSAQNNSQNIFVGQNKRIYPGTNLQVETSAFTHPSNPAIISATAITDYFAGGYTTGFYISTNGGFNWQGTNNIKTSSGATIVTVGDPTLLITNNGNFIIPYVYSTVGVSYSTNNGTAWSPTVYVPGVDTADRIISATDNISGSPFAGRSYIAYDELLPTLREVAGAFLSYSINGGVTWSNAREVNADTISSNNCIVSGLTTGPNGEVYVLWYTDPYALGFAKSTNGGVNWIINDERAISPNFGYGTFTYKNVKLNGLPVLKTDNTVGTRNGWLYAVNLETRSDSIDLVLHRSTNTGNSWTSTKVNQDNTGGTRIQFFPAIDVDKYGGLNIVYYDTRNAPGNDSCEIFMSRSTDGGNTFNDTKISDHKFKIDTPAVRLYDYKGYIGSYIGLTSGNNKITPVWFDNSSGIYQAWTASIELPNLELKIIPEGFYDTLIQKLRMHDTVKVYMRSAVSPFARVDSARAVIDSVSFTASLIFRNLAAGNYYIEARHRNSIETWSSSPVTFTIGNRITYDFTSSAGSAFGSNQKFVKNKWCIYSGDVNQDGIIDGADAALV
ncbi:MAG: sialidase family protein, partial [Ignavibacteria bacterium]